MPPTKPSFTIDRHAVRRQFARRAGRIGDADFLLREVERRMFERLDLIRLAPQRILDVGCGQGHGLLELNRRYPQALTLGVDLALPMLQARARAAAIGSGGRWRTGLARLIGQATKPQVSGGPVTAGADAQCLPLATASIDLVWSNLCWHWLTDPPASLAEWYRVIRPGGLVMFTSFGVDTLRELAALGWPLPPLPDMHDIGDALAQVGFADPVMDTERLTVSYRDVDKMIRELSAIGGNPRSDRSRGLAGRSRLAHWKSALNALRERNNGVISLTVELVHGHAWCPAAKRLPEGLAPVQWHPRPVSAVRTSLAPKSGTDRN